MDKNQRHLSIAIILIVALIGISVVSFVAVDMNLFGVGNEQTTKLYQGEPFIMDVNTVNSGDTSSSEFRIRASEESNYDIEWYDTNGDQIGSAYDVSGHHVIEFPESGSYEVRIYAEQLSIGYSGFYGKTDAPKITAIEQWGDVQWISTFAMFDGAGQLEYNATDTPDLRNVENMGWMFRDTDFTTDLSDWNTSTVKSMSNMFYNSSFNGNISNWDTSNVEDMSSMFSNSEFNKSISSWNTSNLKNMHSMFSNSDFNRDINSWDTSNVEQMTQVFLASEYNKSLSSWDTSNVTDMRAMFRASQFNRDISGWNTSNVESMSLMFLASDFNRSISTWNVQNVESMKNMFASSQFNKNISKWCVEQITTKPEGFDKGTELRNSSNKQPSWGTSCS